MSSKKREKIAAQDLPIYTWTPDQEGKPHSARIGNLPFTFSGQSSEEAAARAEAFRVEEMAEHARFIENRAAAAERMKKRKEDQAQ